MTEPEIEQLRTALKAVSPHYPGFLVKEMAANIDALCDQALKAAPLDRSAAGRELRSVERGDASMDLIKITWLDGATEMYLDIQKAFPLTAPARAYAQQLLEKIRGA